MARSTISRRGEFAWRRLPYRVCRVNTTSIDTTNPLRQASTMRFPRIHDFVERAISGFVDVDADSCVSQSFVVSLTVSVDEPGEYRLCGFYGVEGSLAIDSDALATTDFYGPAVVSVVRPTVSVDVGLSGLLRPGGDVSLSAAFRADAPVVGSVFLARDVCGADEVQAAAADQFQSGFSPVSGFGDGQVVSYTQGVQLPDEVGSFLLCVYASREGHEADPDYGPVGVPVVIGRPVVSYSLGVPGTVYAGGRAALVGSVTSDWPVNVDVFLNRSGDVCRATASQDAGFDQFGAGPGQISVPAGVFKVSLPVTLPAVAGVYRFCVYASRDGHEEDPDNAGLVTGGSIVVVGAAVTAKLSLPGVLHAGGQVQLTGSVTSDYPVLLDVYLNRDGVACQPSSGVDGAFDQFGEGVSGLRVPAGVLAVKESVVLPLVLGKYHLCVYASREGAEDDPDLAIDLGTVTVGGASVAATFSLAKPLRGGQQAMLDVQLKTDWAVTVDVYLNRQAVGCAASSALNGPQDQFQEGVSGIAAPVGTFKSTLTVTLPATLGRYHLCAYAYRDGAEDEPDLALDAGDVTVSRPVVSADVALAGALKAGSVAQLSGQISSDWPVTADVYLNKQGVVCAANSQLNQPADQFQQGLSGLAVPTGGLSLGQTVTLPAQPGVYHLCVYASREGAEDDPDLALDAGQLTITRAEVQLQVSLQGFLVASGMVKVVASALSDYPVSVTSFLNHIDDACAPNAAADQSADRFQVQPELWSVQGGQVDLSSTAQLPDLAGTYHLCSYAAREGVESDPDLIVDSARVEGGTYFIDVQSAGIGEFVYADGTHGTFKAACKLSTRRPVYKQKVKITCPHVSGKIRFTYKRLNPRPSRTYNRSLKMSLKGTAKKSTGGIWPGLYRVQIRWKGWLIYNRTMRVRHQKKKATASSSKTAKKRPITTKA
jgi:hypothetical protein